jgi:hypothetical protein
MTLSTFTGAPGSQDVLPNPLATTNPEGDASNPAHHALHDHSNDAVVATQDVVVTHGQQIAAAGLAGTSPGTVGQVLTASAVDGGGHVTAANWATGGGGGGGGGSTDLSFTVTLGIPTFTMGSGDATLVVTAGIPVFTE